MTRQFEQIVTALGLMFVYVLLLLCALNANHPPPFQQQIHQQHIFARQDEPQRPVWSGWLTCINGNPEYLRSLPTDFTCLPLFGSSGPESLTATVKSWFQQTFDCCFGPLEISHTSLQWLLALWTNCHKESSIRHLKMIWTLPAVPPLQVTYTVNPEDAWVLWNSVRKAQRGESPERKEGEEEDSIDIEEVVRFVQGLTSHFYRHFRLDLSAGHLSQVSTALGSAKYRGRIKVQMSFISHTRTHTRDDVMAYRCLPFVPDLQQQIYDHHPEAPHRMCPPQNAHLSAGTKALYTSRKYSVATANIQP